MKVVKAPPTPAFDDSVIEKAAQETHRMGLSQKIHYWDKRQGKRTEHGDYHPDVVLCGNDPRHGALGIRGDGATLICGQRAPQGGSYCTFTQPVSV